MKKFFFDFRAVPQDVCTNVRNDDDLLGFSMSFGLFKFCVMLFLNNFIILACHTNAHVFSCFLEGNHFVIYCSFGHLQIDAGVLHCVNLVVRKLHLNHSLLMFIRRIFGIFNAIFHIFYSLIHLLFQFVNSSFEHGLGHNEALPAAPEGFDDLAYGFMLYFVHANKCDVKPYFTAVGWSAKIIFIIRVAMFF